MKQKEACRTCGKSLDLYYYSDSNPEDIPVKYRVTDEENGIDTFLCTTDCLLDWAWKVKESQPKLSKSNVDRSSNE